VRRAELALALAAALLVFTRLGATSLTEPDEPRHGAIAEEMRALRHGPAQLAVPRLNDEVYTQKPPLYYWLAAAAGAPFGRVTELAARAPSALAGFGTVLVTARLGAVTFGPATGLAAGAVLLTLPTFVEDARRARPDALVVFFVTLALFLAWRLHAGIGSSRRNRLGLHAALGLGMLAKGPVAFVLVALGLGAWLAWERRIADLRHYASASALALSLAPVALWLATAAALAPEGYLREAVGENVLGRFFAGTSHEQPFLFHLRELPSAFLPWTLAWPLVFLAARRALAPGAKPDVAQATRFFVAFAAAGFAFFSLSAGKRDVYLLPLYPALALLVAEGVRAALPAGAPAATARRRRFLAAGFGTAMTALAGYLVIYLPAVDTSRSIRPAAEVAARLAPAGSPVGLVRNGALVGGLRYYAARPVEPIGSSRGLQTFVETGGAVAVADSRYLPEIEAAVDARVVFRQRLRGDEVVVLALRPRARSS